MISRRELEIFVKAAYFRAKKRKNIYEREIIGIKQDGTLGVFRLNTEKFLRGETPFVREILRLDYNKIKFMRWEEHGPYLVKEALLNYLAQEKDF